MPEPLTPDERAAKTIEGLVDDVEFWRSEAEDLRARLTQLGNELVQERAKPGGSYDQAAYEQLVDEVERLQRERIEHKACEEAALAWEREAGKWRARYEAEVS